MLSSEQVTPSVSTAILHATLTCKQHEHSHPYTEHTCGHLFCGLYWLSCRRCYGSDTQNMTDEGRVFAEHEEQLAGLVGLRAHSLFRHAGGGGIRWTYKADGTMADVPTLGLDEALRIEADCPAELLPLVLADAQTIQSRRGEFFRTSCCDQGVNLGS